MAPQLLRRYSVVTFFLLSYAITWPAWILANRGVAWAAFPGYFGPAIAAAILIAVTQGKTGLETLFTRLRHWQVGIRWYLAAIFFPLLSVLIVIIFQLFSGRAGTLNAKSLSPIWPQVILIIIGSLYGTLVAAGEEIGWRGFALPELLKRHNPLIASLIVGIFWGLWHLPLGWLYSSEGTMIDSLLYGLGIDATAVIYTWLYLNTRGSLLIASLFHAVYDITVILAGSLLGDLFSFRIHMQVLIILAIVLAISTGMIKKKNPTST